MPPKTSYEDYPTKVRRKLDELREVTQQEDRTRERRADLVRELRLTHGVTVDIVAEHAGVTPGMVWHILNPKEEARG